MGKAPGAFLSVGWRSVSRKMLAMSDRFQPDVVVANHSLVNGYVATQLAKLRGIPFITVDHEVGDFYVARENSGWMSVLRDVNQHASLGITVSRRMQDVAVDTIDQGHYQTIYNGASFQPCSQQLLSRHMDKDEISVFCCGNLYGRKDIPLLIRAFSEVSDQFPQARLRIAGDGPDRGSIEALIAGLPCRDRIEMLGSIEHQQVEAEMRAADVFALVGWEEPFGVVFLEAMANGCPVIVSRDAGVAELLEDQQSAFFTSPRDESSVRHALCELFKSASLRACLAKEGHALYGESCTWTARAREYRA
ncbi:MAG: glycosyltransferase family 4 protein, partial [Planctomycetota bacterium]